MKRELERLQELVEFQHQERRLLAFEIHDGLAQQLAAAQMHLRSFEELRKQRPDDAQRQFTAGTQALDEAVAEARRLITGLPPPILDESGLVAAIRWLIHQTQQELEQTRIEFDPHVRFDRLPPSFEMAAFRIVQESLTNAQRHAQAKSIHLRLAQRGSEVEIEVRDWGIGFDRDAVPDTCLGLRGIQERTRLLAGRVNIVSARGEGTRVAVTLPLPQGTPKMGEVLE